MSILVMNVHGPGHNAFYDARKRHEGKSGIDFLTVGEVMDAEGKPIEVGEGDALDAKSRAMRKTLPLDKVSLWESSRERGRCRRRGVGVLCLVSKASKQRQQQRQRLYQHQPPTTINNQANNGAGLPKTHTGAQTNSGLGASPESGSRARRALPVHGGRHALVRGRRGGDRPDAQQGSQVLCSTAVPYIYPPEGVHLSEGG